MARFRMWQGLVAATMRARLNAGEWKVSLDAIRLRGTSEYRLETANRISILHVTAVITLLFSVYAHRMFAIDLLHTITIST